MPSYGRKEIVGDGEVGILPYVNRRERRVRLGDKARRNRDRRASGSLLTVHDPPSRRRGPKVRSPDRIMLSKRD
jgi:hypothetical protein